MHIILSRLHMVLSLQAATSSSQGIRKNLMNFRSESTVQYVRTDRRFQKYFIDRSEKFSMKTECFIDYPDCCYWCPILF